MSQSKQYQKVKLYRTLKVVFYFLGLPLFIFAVFCTAIKFMGEDPFVGTAGGTLQLGFFIGYERFITSPALFGIWCAVGVWALISICHIILSKTVKSRRARMFALLAIILVIMLGGTLVMDAVFDAKIDKMIADAPAGVTIQDYKSQLSYYTHVSYARKVKDLTNSLKTQVQLLEKVYNVEWQGVDKVGVSGNIANKPVDYYHIISDPDENGVCTQGVDIKFVPKEEGGGYEIALDENGDPIPDNDISLEVEGNQLVRIKPNSKGELEIKGKIYSHYFYVTRTAMNGETIYVWYLKDLLPTSCEWDAAKGVVKHKYVDGDYGEGLYNQNGLMSDGWIFSFDNVLNILEDYYEAQEELAKLEAEFGNAAAYQGALQAVKESALDIMESYYDGAIPLPSTVTETGEGEYVDPWVAEHYKQDAYYTERFSLTRGELENLLAQVGALLGDNHLFDWIFGSGKLENLLGGIGGLIGGSLGDTLGPLLANLAKGISLKSFFVDAETGEVPEASLKTLNTVFDWVKKLTGKSDDYVLNDIYIVLAYKNMDQADAIVQKDHLYLAVYADNGEGGINATPEGLLLDIDFDDGLLDGGEEDEYNFDLDRLSAFLNRALNTVLTELLKIDLSDEGNIVNTILGLVLKDIDVNGLTYKGLVISGIEIPLINPEGQIDIDINDILANVVRTLYAYQSPLIKPVWEFYEEAFPDAESELGRAAHYLKQYEKAMFEATVCGNIMGSTLIGDSLGGGTYASSFGLGDLASVRQLKTDLSYQRVYFPLYGFRDMLLAFSGIVLLFYFLSFVAAQKEELYAQGKLLGKVTKEDLEKEMMQAPSSPDPSTVVFEEIPSPEGDISPADAPPLNDSDFEDLSVIDLTDEVDEEAPPLPVDPNNDEEVK